MAFHSERFGNLSLIPIRGNKQPIANTAKTNRKNDAVKGPQAIRVYLEPKKDVAQSIFARTPRAKALVGFLVDSLAMFPPSKCETRNSQSALYKK